MIVGLTKIAVLLFYTRVFPSKSILYITHVLIGVCAAYTLSLCIVLFLVCRPISSFWTQWRNPGRAKCININASSWAAAAINIFLDAAVLALPIREVLRLQISSRKKIQVLCMFLVGGV